VVAMEVAGTGDQAVLSVLMRDIGPHLVPPGDEPVPQAQHQAFLAHMAALSVAFWGWGDGIGLTTMAQRLRFFAPDNIAGELAAENVPGPIAAAAAGWQRLPERSAVLWNIARLVHERPEVITGPIADTPSTFLQGDWKMGNLGSHPDGRTILLDWAYPGSGPACWDLCWYLALNRARLPESKESAIGRYRTSLEASGISTTPWWERQLDLCMIGIMATFGTCVRTDRRRARRIQPTPTDRAGRTRRGRRHGCRQHRTAPPAGADCGGRPVGRHAGLARGVPAAMRRGGHPCPAAGQRQRR